MIIAQGKTAEAAALGKSHPIPTLPFFCSGAPAGWRAKTEKGGIHITSLTQGGARSSLALGYYIIVPTGLQFGLLRSHNWPTTIPRLPRLRSLVVSFLRALVYLPFGRRTTSSTEICVWGVAPSGTTTCALPMATMVRSHSCAPTLYALTVIL
jgi:hypothetical protein